jgi:hypothetical protein
MESTVAADTGERITRGVLLLLGIYQVALAGWMVIDPGSFFDNVGPFGSQNDHYIRDNATFTLAAGVVSLVAARRQAWRLPVLAFLSVQFVTHALNHLVDIDEADPKAVGVFDFVALTVIASLIVWLFVRETRLRR